jgi:hypothetical protein
MTLEEVKARLVGRTIVKVEADEWNEEYLWLTRFDSVRITLDDGTVLDSTGEPLTVEFP